MKPTKRELTAAIEAGKKELEHQKAALESLGDDCSVEMDGVLEEQDKLWAEQKAASQALSAFPAVKGKMGLTSEETKANPEYRALKQRYERSAQALRDFNGRNAAAIKAARKGGRDAEIEMDEAEIDVEEDCNALDSARRVVFDRRMETIDGHLVVTGCHITKANVCGYMGAEIPNSEALGLDPSKIYMLYRDPAEIEAAVSTYDRVPLLMQHVAVSADKPQQFLTVGTLSNAKFSHPYLDADLTVWTREGIEAIESGEQKEISAGYRYVPDMTPGTSPEGEKYDGRMTQIIANHVALVEAGRAGPDVCVAE